MLLFSVHLSTVFSLGMACILMKQQVPGHSRRTVTILLSPSWKEDLYDLECLLQYFSSVKSSKAISNTIKIQFLFVLFTRRKGPGSVEQSPCKLAEGRPGFQQVSQKRHVCGFTTKSLLPI